MTYETDLLGVYSALQLCEIRLRINSSKENRLVLVHASIGEQERRIRERHYGRRGDCLESGRSDIRKVLAQELITESVAILLEIVEESVPDLDRRPFGLEISLCGHTGNHTDRSVLYTRPDVRCGLDKDIAAGEAEVEAAENCRSTRKSTVREISPPQHSQPTCNLKHALCRYKI